MRDPKRISRILFKIGRYWIANPDLRLTQLLRNITPNIVDTYYLEDDTLEKTLDILLETPP